MMVETVFAQWYQLSSAKTAIQPFNQAWLPCRQPGWRLQDPHTGVGSRCVMRCSWRQPIAADLTKGCLHRMQSQTQRDRSVEEHIYPELQGEILLSQPGQKALYTLSQEGLLTSALLQDGVLGNPAAGLIRYLAIQRRRYYEQVTASLIHEIVDQ